jgi:hypothetical protein
MSSDSTPDPSDQQRSGGIDIDSDETDIGGDVVGRDVMKAGRDFIVAQPGSVVNVNSGEPARPAQPTAADAPVSRTTSVVNPFGYKGKITDPALYLVRQPLTKMVFDELRKGVSLSIVGDSQTGKSSLLLHIVRAGPTVADGTQPAHGHRPSQRPRRIDRRRGRGLGRRLSRTGNGEETDEQQKFSEHAWH